MKLDEIYDLVRLHDSKTMFNKKIGSKGARIIINNGEKMALLVNTDGAPLALYHSNTLYILRYVDSHSTKRVNIFKQMLNDKMWTVYRACYCWKRTDNVVAEVFDKHGNLLQTRCSLRSPRDIEY